MTKINFSLVKELAVLGIIIFLIFSGKVMAQDSFFLQKASQSCLNHSEVQPHLKAVSFGEEIDVLAIVENEYATSKMKLTQFGKAAVISHKTELFFYAIEDYVRLSGVTMNKDKITLIINSGVEISCVYSGKKGKVMRIDTSELK